MAEKKSKRQKQEPPTNDATEAIPQANGSSAPSSPAQSPSTGRITDYLVGNGPSTMDTSGEVGHPSGKGTLEIDEQQVSSEPIPDAHPRVDEKGKKTGGKAA